MTLSQKSKAEMLNVAQKINSDCLKVKNLKNGCHMNWMTICVNVKFCFRSTLKKAVLHRILTSDKNGFIFRILNEKKSWLNKSSISTSKLDRFGRKTMLCVRWDQKAVVYHQLLKPDKTVNTDLYRQRIIKLNHVLIENLPDATR